MQRKTNKFNEITIWSFDIHLKPVFVAAPACQPRLIVYSPLTSENLIGLAASAKE